VLLLDENPIAFKLIILMCNVCEAVGMSFVIVAITE
jgi:hypothetical protein